MARIRTIAVVGDGPAGSTLAARLARRGRQVVLYSSGRRPPLLVGESLVPAIIPHLQELGVEEEVAGYGVLKPGATFVLNPGESQRVSFAEFAGRGSTTYAFNVPRDRFDATLLRAAEAAGAHRVARAATLERSDDGEGVRLSDATLEAAGGLLDGQPDLVVDATGRARTLARLLGLPSHEGDRKDAALFAHLSNVPLANPGHVHSDRLQRGWAWRIPLPDRVSLGVVVAQDVLREYGRTAEEQYDRFLQADPWLKGLTESSERLTPVMRYSNYQLTGERAYGPRGATTPRWAIVGDALGFIDPVFSSGLVISMDGSKQLAAAVLQGTPRAFARYERRLIAHIEAWRRAVGYFYDGRLFSMFKVKEEVQDTPLGRMVNPHIGRHVARIFTGEAATHPYSRRLLDFLVTYGLRDHDPAEYTVS